jgi:choline kinase
MTYIILAAGSGTRLHPITLRLPKTLFSLDASTTILSRMADSIRRFDGDAQIIVVTGFQRERLTQHVSNVEWVHNPFFADTNSIASLWFAKQYLNQEVTILNGDIVMSYALMENIVTKQTDKPYVLMDTSILKNGDYNIQADNGTVIVMSKSLTAYSGEYAGVTKLDAVSAKRLQNKLDEMVNSGIYTHWYEDALVQMIFEDDFILYTQDVSQYEWTEVDNVDDLMYAKKIHQKDCEGR